jgi:hypothetical protein
MAEPLFDEALEALRTNVAQSTGDNLLGFEMDLLAALAEEELLRDPVAERSEADSTITARAELAPSAGSLQQVQELLFRVWQRTCYHGFQATSLELRADLAELRFMTGATPHLGVTGTVQVCGPHYQKLYRKNR